MKNFIYKQWIFSPLSPPSNFFNFSLKISWRLFYLLLLNICNDIHICTQICKLLHLALLIKTDVQGWPLKFGFWHRFSSVESALEPNRSSCLSQKIKCHYCIILTVLHVWSSLRFTGFTAGKSYKVLLFLGGLCCIFWYHGYNEHIPRSLSAWYFQFLYPTL